LRTVGSGTMITSGWMRVIAGHPVVDVVKFKSDRSMQPFRMDRHGQSEDMRRTSWTN
jgi:hypothetical protein